MENEEQEKPEIISAKIGTIPTHNAWSQAYSAGSLFATLVLTKDSIEEENEENTLSSIGKEVLDNLEKEYFTLEEKNLNSIKNAIEKTLQNIPPVIETSLIVAVIPFSSSNDNVLYVFICGKGKILLKRQGKIGIILSSDPQITETISASGFLENNDLIIIETEKFGSLVSQDRLLSACNDLPPSEIAESLSPEIHEKQEGDASAIFIRYTKKNTEKDTIAEESQQQVKYEKPQKLSSLLMKISSKVLPIINKISLPKTNITHTKKMFLTISAILVIILISSIFFGVKKQNDTKTEALFQNIYTPAQQKYDEGQNLLSLNKNVAKDDFIASQKILTNAKNQFKKGSPQYQKINDLLQKVQAGLSQTSGIIVAKAQKMDKDTSTILAYQIDTKVKAKTLFVQDSDNIYQLSMENVTTVDKTKNTKKTIIKNNNDWHDVDGFSVYLGNIYILDKQSNQILKFVSTSDSYAKSSYFKTDSKPNLANVSSMGIDGSIWLLYKDGSIQQFTRGELQSFKNPTLDSPLANNSRIFTDVDTNSLYILDTKNKRIVVIGKDSIFKSQYTDPVLAKAQDLEIVEKNKTMYILSEGNVYKLELK